MNVRYSVDLDLLADTSRDLQHCEERFAQLSTDLDQRVEALHLTWTGRAADAHAEAQAEWSAGFTEMQEGLADMRRWAMRAHNAYTQAIEANLAIWR